MKKKLIIFAPLIAILFVTAMTLLVFHFYGTNILQYPTKHQLNEYRKIKGCQALKKRFELDKKNNELKFFMFGLLDKRSDDLIATLEKKYNITIFAMGCVRTNEYDCYNQQVTKYLITTFKDSVLVRGN